MDTNGENSKVWGMAFPVCLEERRRFVFFSLLETGLRRDRSLQLGRSLHFLRVLVHMRMGEALLSGHNPESGVGHC